MSIKLILKFLGAIAGGTLFSWCCMSIGGENMHNTIIANLDHAYDEAERGGDRYLVNSKRKTAAKLVPVDYDQVVK